MSSPTPIAGRKIAPLPLRSRRSRGTGSSQNVLNQQGTLTQNSSAETAQTDESLSTSDETSNHPSSHCSPNATTHAHQLSPPELDVTATGIFPASNSTPSERQGTFTFRGLHNITPRPSTEPEKRPLSSTQDSRIGLDDSSLPILSTPAHEIPQPLHTMYSEEKIAIPSSDKISEQGIPRIFEDHFHDTVDTYRPPSSEQTNPQSLPRQSDLRPSLDGPRQRSVSDASVVSDIHDSPVPYDVRDEEAPLEPFFTPIFQAALQSGLAIAKSVVTTIDNLVGSSGQSANLDRLLEDAKRLSTFQSSDTRTIAVLGDSGEGKSSLINALLHFSEIAKTGDIGEACTSVVTEYRQKQRHHTAPITIEVEYLSKSEIEDLINELLWNYRQLFLPNVEDDKVDPKDYARYQRESEQAWSALEAGFKHQRGFNKKLLSDMSEGGLEKAKDKLIQWAHELEWPDNDNSGVWKSTVDTSEQCCQMTSIFMQDRFWPFTKIIRVYLNAQVLKTGVILADLPGLQDTNLAKVRATQVYLMKCDNVFIVAKISRAITDQSLKSSIYSVLSRHAPVEWEESGGKSMNLAVVCTKSEDINQKTARREFCGPQKRISPSVMEQLDNDIEDAKRNGYAVLKKQLKRKQEFLLINSRNSHVKEGLQNAYASKIPGGRLDVFCVSNTTYEKFSRKGNTEMVHASGIPELRRFCHTITATAQLLEAKHFLRSALSSLLNSVELWASSVSSVPEFHDIGPDDSIHAVMKEIREQISTAINKSKAEFKDTFREVLSEYLERRNHFWEQAAGAKGREWHNWHWTQFNAWCMNNGDHSTLKLGYLNWNSELIWKMRMELAYQWGLLEEEIPTVFEAPLLFIRTCLIDLQSQLRAQCFASALIDGIDFRVQDVEYRFSLVQQEFSREVRLIQRYASEPNDSSYVVSEMRPAYRAAASEMGTGKAGRQRSIVQGRIENGTLFPNISAKIQENMDQLIRKTFRDLKREMNAVLELVDNDVEMAVASNRRRQDAARNQVDPEEERRKEKMVGEIMKNKREHEELLASIASI